MKTTIGGDRLGSGNKQEVSAKNYSRSTHDLSYLWRSSMSAGTLVPFMTEVGLPGDSFDIDLNVDVMTLPTIGPLFGSYKVQLDVFTCPIRLYNGKLHMNMLGIGMEMNQIYLPQVRMKADWDENSKDDNQQINPSSIWSYLNIRGLGRKSSQQSGEVQRLFNAVPYLSYWDIYKNYYANKQEEVGVVISTDNIDGEVNVVAVYVQLEFGRLNIFQQNRTFDTFDYQRLIIVVEPQLFGADIDINNTFVRVNGTETAIADLFTEFYWDGGEGGFVCDFYRFSSQQETWEFDRTTAETIGDPTENPTLKKFDLDSIDQMRMNILKHTDDEPFEINMQSFAPYGLSLGKSNGEWRKKKSQEGLGIKTYQSDLFNNWISTEWIDGTNGINEVTAVSTSGDSFTIDSLNLAQKVYNMLNRIAISGGTYDDWLDAVYTHDRAKSVESPVYAGSLIKELAFEEVISTAQTNGDVPTPLGQLAGRGRLTQKNKGGKIKIKVNEPSYIMGIVSLTPRIDYSQGNKWDVNLRTLDDLHKPALDEIGYQDLITDQMAWFDTVAGENPIYRSAGKQPAWINYMTNVNQVRGNFAIREKEMFMTLNRRYEQNKNGIVDLTTYIDPAKFNNIFAETNPDAQNFWVQISNKITARRKMSAKVIPNL